MNTISASGRLFQAEGKLGIKIREVGNFLLGKIIGDTYGQNAECLEHQRKGIS